MKNITAIGILAFTGCLSLYAYEIEPKGKAISSLLGTSKAQHKNGTFSGKAFDTFYSVDDQKRPKDYVFIEKANWNDDPKCTHTWAIKVSAKTKAIDGIKTIEIGCPHAKPTTEESFTLQYQGKTFKDVAKLDGDIDIKVGATGSCLLLTDAVKRTLRVVNDPKALN